MSNSYQATKHRKNLLCGRGHFAWGRHERPAATGTSPVEFQAKSDFTAKLKTNHAQSDSGQDIFHSGAMTVKLEKCYHKTTIIAQR